MDFIIVFFRDFLDGPVYIVVAVVCGILICSCIGYLGEQYLKKKEEQKQYEATHAAIANSMVDGSKLTASKQQNAASGTSLE